MILVFFLFARGTSNGIKNIERIPLRPGSLGNVQLKNKLSVHLMVDCECTVALDNIRVYINCNFFVHHTVCVFTVFLAVSVICSVKLYNSLVGC